MAYKGWDELLATTNRLLAMALKRRFGKRSFAKLLPRSLHR